MIEQAVQRLIVLAPSNEDKINQWNTFVVEKCFELCSGTLFNANQFCCSLDIK